MYIYLQLSSRHPISIVAFYTVKILKNSIIMEIF